jgi:hypothetical protein
MPVAAFPKKDSPPLERIPFLMNRTTMSAKEKRAFHLLCAVCIVCFAAMAFLMIHAARQRGHLVADAKEMAKEEIAKSIQTLEAPLKIIEQDARSIAADAGPGSLEGAALDDRLKEAVRKNPDILEITVAHTPSSHEPDRPLYGPSAEMSEGKACSFDLGEREDYAHAAWYEEALAGRVPAWSEPYLCGQAKKAVVSYNIPFFRSGDDRTVAGMVHVAVSIDRIRKYASSMELGHSLVRLIISRKGTFVYHPLKELVDKQGDILKSLKGTQARKHEMRLRAALKGERVFIEERDPASQAVIWTFCEPLPETGWCLMSVYIKDQFTIKEIVRRRQHIIIILVAILFLTTLSALLSGAWTLKKQGLWLTSFFFALFCTLGTCSIWYMVFSEPLNSDSDAILLTDRVALHKALSSYEAHIKKGSDVVLTYVPTGIYLETLEFTSSNNLKAVGYVWQKYARGLDSTIVREPTFPEASSLSLNEVSRTIDDDTEVIRWKFEATIREYFDYSKYPFDRPDIWLWIKHGGLDNRVILIPDFSAYKVMSPQTCPGLPNNGLVFPGYTLMGTFFDYQKTIATTDFGVNAGSGSETFPELYYHILARRNILNPFVSKLFPLLIMLSMLFVVKLKFSNNEEEKQMFGLNGLTVLGTVISFFFTTMLSQSNFRSEINVERITFLEDFHLITYFMLFLMAVTTFFFIGSRKPSILEYEDCLVSKILYWPIVTGLVLSATIIHYF